MNPAAVVGVHRMSQFEHDVVRHVDGQGEIRLIPDSISRRRATTATAPAGRFRWPGTRANLLARARTRRTGSAGPVEGSGVHGVGGIDEFQVIGAGDLAGDTAHRHAVAAVRGDGQVRNTTSSRPGRTAVASAPGSFDCGRQHQDAGMIDTKAQFGGRADRSAVCGFGWRSRNRRAGPRRQGHHHHPLTCKVQFDARNFKYSFGKDTTKQISSLESHVPPRSSNSIFLPARKYCRFTIHS